MQILQEQSKYRRWPFQLWYTWLQLQPMPTVHSSEANSVLQTTPTLDKQFHKDRYQLKREILADISVITVPLTSKMAESLALIALAALTSVKIVRYVPLDTFYE